VSEQKLEDIKKRVLDKALVFLSSKPRSLWETRTRINYYLKKYKSCTQSQKQKIQSDILKHLETLNLLDDNKYAKLLVKEKINSKKPSSKYEIKTFLMKKRIPHKCIEKAIKTYSRDVKKEKVKNLA